MHPAAAVTRSAPEQPDATDVNVLSLAGQRPAGNGEWLVITEADSLPGSEFVAWVLPVGDREAHGGDVLVRLAPGAPALTSVAIMHHALRRDDNLPAPALPAPLPDVLQPRAGQVEDILRSLDITEPGMLLRAAAIDQAARDVLANATASSRNRDSINQPPQRKPATPDRAPATAGKDVIHAGADTRQHVTPAGSVRSQAAGHAPQRAPRNSPGAPPVT